MARTSDPRRADGMRRRSSLLLRLRSQARTIPIPEIPLFTAAPAAPPRPRGRRHLQPHASARIAQTHDAAPQKTRGPQPPGGGGPQLTALRLRALRRLRPRHPLTTSFPPCTGQFDLRKNVPPRIRRTASPPTTSSKKSYRPEHQSSRSEHREKKHTRPNPHTISRTSPKRHVPTHSTTPKHPATTPCDDHTTNEKSLRNTPAGLKSHKNPYVTPQGFPHFEHHLVAGSRQRINKIHAAPRTHPPHVSERLSPAHPCIKQPHSEEAYRTETRQPNRSKRAKTNYAKPPSQSTLTTQNGPYRSAPAPHGNLQQISPTRTDRIPRTQTAAKRDRKT